MVWLHNGIPEGMIFGIRYKILPTKFLTIATLLGHAVKDQELPSLKLSALWQHHLQVQDSYRWFHSWQAHPGMGTVKALHCRPGPGEPRITCCLTSAIEQDGTLSWTPRLPPARYQLSNDLWHQDRVEPWIQHQCNMFSLKLDTIHHLCGWLAFYPALPWTRSMLQFIMRLTISLFEWWKVTFLCKQCDFLWKH